MGLEGRFKMIPWKKSVGESNLILMYIDHAALINALSRAHVTDFYIT